MGDRDDECTEEEAAYWLERLLQECAEPVRRADLEAEAKAASDGFERAVPKALAPCAPAAPATRSGGTSALALRAQRSTRR
ncbi:MAG: hypothetical protein IT384_33090 [Deltaproteobacteria bacterium]|nr:hypothetical protein [Deltaproteobacteria bacterium]